MDELQKKSFSTLHIGHLGLVADKIKCTGLMKLIDQRLPVSKAHGSKVTHGERVAAMILNGLGFIDNRLYLFPNFLKDRPVECLFQKALKAEWFNDDALGRCLDEIAAYGSTKLFTELGLIIGKARGLLGNSMHLDTTTLSLFGSYEKEEGFESPLKPERGYAKSGRHDLKQMILLLATTGASHFPIWMEAHSGNVSDQKSLPNAAVRLRKFCRGLEGSESFIYVGDSAIYSNILEHSDQMRWITRVPSTLKQAQNLIEKEADALKWTKGEKGYSWSELKTSYKEVEQRWVLFFSEAAYTREIKTLYKRIEKMGEVQKKAWWHLSNRVFACESDAFEAIKQQRKTLMYHSVEAGVSVVKRHTGRGRPKAGEKAKIVGYKIVYQLGRDENAISKKAGTKGRFILATNILDEKSLSSEALLKEYKAQSGVEKSFKFLKNNTFEVDSVFLKTPARIEALMMVMTLCLMIYGLSEYELHQSLARTGDTIPNPSQKQTSRPSLRWVYCLFRVVNELHIEMGDMLRKFVVNVDEVLSKIVKHFGHHAQRIYLNSS